MPIVLKKKHPYSHTACPVFWCAFLASCDSVIIPLQWCSRDSPVSLWPPAALPQTGQQLSPINSWPYKTHVQSSPMGIRMYQYDELCQGNELKLDATHHSLDTRVYFGRQNCRRSFGPLPCAPLIILKLHYSAESSLIPDSSPVISCANISIFMVMIWILSPIQFS